MSYDIINKEMERLRKENEALLKKENERSGIIEDLKK